MYLIGFLENLSYGSETGKMSHETGISPGLLRHFQDDALKMMLDKSQVPFRGPMGNISHYYIRIPDRLDSLANENVLHDIGLDESLTIAMPGIGSEIKLGVLIRPYQKDRYAGKLSILDNNLIDFGKRVSAFRRQRNMDEPLPYFIICDRKFDELYPMDPLKDRFIFW